MNLLVTGMESSNIILKNAKFSDTFHFSQFGSNNFFFLISNLAI